MQPPSAGDEISPKLWVHVPALEQESCSGLFAAVVGVFWQVPLGEQRHCSGCFSEGHG